MCHKAPKHDSCWQLLCELHQDEAGQYSADEAILFQKDWLEGILSSACDLTQSKRELAEFGILCNILSLDGRVPDRQ